MRLRNRQLLSSLLSQSVSNVTLAVPQTLFFATSGTFALISALFFTFSLYVHKKVQELLELAKAEREKMASE